MNHAHRDFIMEGDNVARFHRIGSRNKQKVISYKSRKRHHECVRECHLHLRTNPTRKQSASSKTIHYTVSTANTRTPHTETHLKHPSMTHSLANSDTNTCAYSRAQTQPHKHTAANTRTKTDKQTDTHRRRDVPPNTRRTGTVTTFAMFSEHIGWCKSS